VAVFRASRLFRAGRGLSNINGTEHFLFSFSHHPNCPMCKQEMRKIATMRFEDFFNQGGTILTWDIWKKEER
jgi:hypothetical protein